MSFLLAVHVCPNGGVEIPPSRRRLGATARGGLLPPPGARAGNCRPAAWAGPTLWPGAPPPSQAQGCEGDTHGDG